VKPRGGYSFLVPPQGGNLFYTLFLLNLPTNVSQNVLKQGNAGPETATIYATVEDLSQCIETNTCRASVPLAVGDKRLSQ
jgi:hypothetical protein